MEASNNGAKKCGKINGAITCQLKCFILKISRNNSKQSEKCAFNHFIGKMHFYAAYLNEIIYKICVVKNALNSQTFNWPKKKNEFQRQEYTLIARKYRHVYILLYIDIYQ